MWIRKSTKNLEKILQFKKVYFYFLIFLSFFCIAADMPEEKEYAFFANSYEEAEKIAREENGELISFCHGIGVLKKTDIIVGKSGWETNTITLYPNEVFTVENTNTYEQQEQWHLEVLQMEEVWETTTGKGINVAVIDSGIDSNHEDLKEGIIYLGTTIPETEYGFNKMFEESYKGVEDYFSHGTHVAGIIGARSNGIGCTGIAPDCNIISIKALEKQGNRGKGKVSWVASAISLAIEQGADIINLSLGGSSVKNEMLYTMIKEAWERNIPVVCAAGNISTSSIIFYPGAYEETIAVSAVKKAGDYVEFDSSFSNYGDWIDISAPGSNIMSTVPKGYGTKSGTSMACPVVSASLALLLEEKKDLNLVELCDLLYSSSTDLGDKGKDNQYGNGVINIKQMVENFKSRYLDYTPILTFENDSIIRKGVEIPIRSPKEGIKVVYTMDGSLPNEESPLYPEEGMVFPKEMDVVNINIRCVLEDGNLGRNISVTYKFIDSERSIEKSGELEEKFPIYGNFIEKDTNYPYKKYELTLKPNEKLKFYLRRNEFKGVLDLYDSPELEKLLKTGKEDKNGDQLLEWTNKSKDSKKLYIILKVTDLATKLEDISFHINWTTQKVQKENNNMSPSSNKEEQKSNDYSSTDINTEDTDTEQYSEKKIEEKKDIIKEVIIENGTNEVKVIPDVQQEEIIYEDDWLYTMDEGNASSEKNINKEKKFLDSIRQENIMLEEQKEEEKRKKTELEKTKSSLFIIGFLGIFFEILVVVWLVLEKKNDKRKKSKK